MSVAQIVKRQAPVIIAGAMIFGGIFILSSSSRAVLTPATAKKSLTTNLHPATPQTFISEQPVRLFVPSADIALSVRRGVYDQNLMTWLVPGNEAYFADGSVQPNNSTGTTYIYGHANKKAFLNLDHLKEGDIAVVQGESKSFYYELVGNITTTSSDTSRLTKSGPPLLVLQTCTGLHFQYRAQYVFKFVRVA